MLQIKARREHHAAAMLAHVESLATSWMQSSKANREIERRFAVARHEPKDVLHRFSHTQKSYGLV